MPTVERKLRVRMETYHMFRHENMKHFLQMRLVKLHDKHPNLHEYDHVSPLFYHYA